MTPTSLARHCPDRLPESDTSATSLGSPNIVLRQASKPGSGSRVRGGFGRQKPGIFANFRKTPSRRHSNAAVRPSTTSAIHANNRSMEVRSDPVESAKSNLFDTSSWGEFCDVTLTLRQGHQPDSGGWVKIEDYRCREAFRHFMNLLNRAVYGAAFRRYGKRLRVLPVLEKARSALAHCVHGSVARPVDGIFIVQLNCPRTSMLLPLKA